MKLALVYDWIDKWGGAERILTTLFSSYPQADIFTLYYDPKTAVWARPFARRIKTTFLQKPYELIRRKPLLTPAMPFAIESFDLSRYEAVLSVSSSFAKGVITRPETHHVSYIFAPTRFLWHESTHYTKHTRVRWPVTRFLREWDMIASTRPDTIATLSTHARELINNIYHRDSLVLPPPFDYQYFAHLAKHTRRPSFALPSRYFLFVGRLEPYKRVDVLIEAFRRRKDASLVIVGSGSAQRRLMRQAWGMRNVVFCREHLSDKELSYVYSRAQALIMPQQEDFGYTALEALFFNCPVIASAFSGTAELVRHGVNGILFKTQSPASIISTLDKFHTYSYNTSITKWHRFSKTVFLETVRKLLYKR